MSLPAVAVKAATAGKAGGGTRARTPHSRAAVGVARQHVKDAKAGTSVDALRADLTRRGFAPETIDAATAATPAPAQVSPGRAETTAPARPGPQPSRTFGGTGSGILLGLIAYPVLLAYINGGAAKVRQWFAAKWLNKGVGQPESMPTGGSSSGTW